MDLAFAQDGRLYVDEFDEASSGAVELAIFFGLPPQMLGGTVNVCDPANWTCREVTTGLSMPISVAVTKNGKIHVAINALTPDVGVITLP